jgi:hypothetical protein
VQAYNLQVQRSRTAVLKEVGGINIERRKIDAKIPVRSRNDYNRSVDVGRFFSCLLLFPRNGVCSLLVVIRTILQVSDAHEPEFRGIEY